MKVLWFTNTVSGAEFHLKQKASNGGWIKSLELEIKEHVELSVAFYNDKNIQPFSIGRTKYYPIYRNRTFIRKILDNLFNRLEPNSDIQKFIDVINQVKPDIIHIHGTENPFGNIINKCEIPIVVSIQGIMSVIHYKFFAGMTSKLAKLTFGVRNILLQRSPYNRYKKFNKMSIREKNILKKVKYIIGRTDFDRRVCRVLSPQAHYFHVGEILRSSFYENEWRYKKKEQLIIHSTMSTEFYKGLNLIGSSILILKELKVDFIWYIAGIEDNAPIIKTVSRKLGTTDWLKHIKFLGILDENMLIKSMLQAGVYVMPSNIENSPNSLCEAMLIGMPCISTYAGGSISLLSDGEDGILVQPNEPWSLSGAILELYDNPILSEELGENARIRALERHNPKRIIEKMIDVYGEIIKN